MHEIESRIYVSDDILLHEWDYLYGDKKDVKVGFAYYNFVKDRETRLIDRTYADQLELARYRRGDKRYRNYEFLIG